MKQKSFHSTNGEFRSRSSGRFLFKINYFACLTVMKYLICQFPASFFVKIWGASEGVRQCLTQCSWHKDKQLNKYHSLVRILLIFKTHIDCSKFRCSKSVPVLPYNKWNTHIWHEVLERMLIEVRRYTWNSIWHMNRFLVLTV